jgi:hypothetical protein
MKYEKDKNFQKFVNEILDDVIMVNDKVIDYQFYKETGLFNINCKKNNC